LFRAIGARLEEGNGSRVRFVLGERRATFHRPHPEPTTDKGSVVSVRRLLSELGDIPEEEETE